MLTKMMFNLLLLFCVYTVCLSDEPGAPEVEIPLGKLSGTWKLSLGRRKYASFEGIPYAQAPVGELRFEEPQPVKPWTGVWQATHTHMCPQLSRRDNGEEDCLYLNVYVPTETMDHQKKFDVVVVFHGGAFMMGNGHQMARSQFLMDRDIILVSINYRLGILGFLSTEDQVIPGNNGMKDQVLALKWVKDNIASFGGKPESVTILGISAGGASVHLHYFSPLSKNLFVRGISQSGSALDPWVIRRKPAEKAKKVGVLLGCPEGTTAELKECLKERPVALVLEQQNKFYGFGQMPFSPFGPVIEKASKNAFLTEEPYKLLKGGKVFDVPWVISTCADEGLLPAAWYHAELEKVDKDWQNIAHYVLDYNDTIPLSKQQEIANQIKDYYLGSGEHINEATFKNFTKIFTDRLFATGAETSAKLQSKVNESPVYFYYFNYHDGENKASSFFTEKDLGGVSHGEDGIYFYGILSSNEFSEGDFKVKNACQDFLYSFATTGKASFDGTDQWQPTKSSELTYLNITDGDNMKLQTRDTLVPADFWRNIGLLEFESYSVKDEL